jgi:hypothetical protein
MAPRQGLRRGTELAATAQVGALAAVVALALVAEGSKAVGEGTGPRPNCDVVPPDMFDAYFWVDDVDGLHAELLERGAELLHGPVEQGYGLREIRARDPHGYVLAFGQRRQSRPDRAAS